MKRYVRYLSAALAAVLVCTSFAGCKSSSSATGSGSLAPYEIKWYLDGTPQSGMAPVIAEVNKKLKPINATLNLQIVDIGSYDQKMQMVNSAGEKYDLCFTSSWANNYYTNVNNGAFVALDSYLNKYGSEIKSTLPAAGWNATRINGKIYAIPNYQIWAMTNVLNVQKSLADKYGLEPKNVKTLSDIEPFLAKVKAGEQGVTPMGVQQNQTWGETLVMHGFDEIAGRDVPGVIRLSDTSCQAVDQFESQEFQQFIAMMHKWYQAGYINKDAAINGDTTSILKTGNVACATGGNYGAGPAEASSSTFGNRVVYNVQLSPSYLETSSILGTLNSVSSTSKDPARAVMFMNLMFKDKALSNLLMIGIENKNYKTDSDGRVQMIKNSGYDCTFFSWEMGNQFNQKIVDTMPASTWDDTKKINSSAKASPLLGFNFNPQPVQSQISNVSAITKEYCSQLESGSADPTTVYPKFISRLKAAGLSDILAEEQKQIKAWKASDKTSSK
jgi:putative aldouronate transport system substrate-binding protein